VGLRLQASDPDLGQKLDFTLVSGSSKAMEIFQIESCSGQVSVKKDIGDDGHHTLNFEAFPNVFEIVVRVTDSGLNPKALHDDALVTITVLNIPEPPVIYDQFRDIHEHPLVGQAVGDTLKVYDDDEGQEVSMKYKFISGNHGRCGNVEVCPLFSVSDGTGQVFVQGGGTPSYSFSTTSGSGVAVFAGTPFESSLLSITFDGVEWSGTMAINTVYPEYTGYACESFELITYEQFASPKLGKMSNLRIRTLGNNTSITQAKFKYIGSFEVQGFSGRTADIFDYESRVRYDLTLRAVDIDGEFADFKLLVNILDVEEPPELLISGRFSASESSANGKMQDHLC
jgi:hypothetical protein